MNNDISSEFEPGWYLCFDWTRFWVFNIELCLLRLDLRLNLESVPRIAEIWVPPILWTQGSSNKLYLAKGSSDQNRLRDNTVTKFVLQEVKKSYLWNTLAFDTPTGMPYGTVNLRHGVPAGETPITCTAGVGTFLIEFGKFSAGLDCRFSLPQIFLYSILNGLFPC